MSEMVGAISEVVYKSNELGAGSNEGVKSDELVVRAMSEMVEAMQRHPSQEL